jgi:hypothetical protein
MSGDDICDRLDQQALEAVSRLPLSALDKSLPEAAAGQTVADFLASGPRLSAFSTPLLVLTDSMLDSNVAQMATWCAEKGVGLAPHGKTTMAPTLWDRQLRAGAWVSPWRPPVSFASPWSSEHVGSSWPMHWSTRPLWRG